MNAMLMKIYKMQKLEHQTLASHYVLRVLVKKNQVGPIQWYIQQPILLVIVQLHRQILLCLTINGKNNYINCDYPDTFCCIRVITYSLVFHIFYIKLVEYQFVCLY